MPRTQEAGAITLVIIFVLGIWLAIPDEAGLGSMIVDSLEKSSCPGLKGFCEEIPTYRLAFIAAGILLIVGDLAAIYFAAEKGNWI